MLAVPGEGFVMPRLVEGILWFGGGRRKGCGLIGDTAGRRRARSSLVKRIALTNRAWQRITFLTPVKRNFK